MLTHATALSYAHKVFTEDMTPAGLARAIESYHKELIGEIDAQRLARQRLADLVSQLEQQRDRWKHLADLKDAAGDANRKENNKLRADLEKTTQDLLEAIDQISSLENRLALVSSFADRLPHSAPLPPVMVEPSPFDAFTVVS